MKNKSISYILIVFLLLISSFFSWTAFFKQYYQSDSVLISNFPKEIAGWTSVEMPLTEEEYAILETRNVVARKYFSPVINNNPTLPRSVVYLYMVYSQNNRKVSHAPEVCYTGGGVSITQNQKDSIEIPSKSPLIVNRLLLELGSARQFTFYWFKVGNSFTHNYWMQQLLIAVKTLTGKPHSSALIRVSCDVLGGDAEKAIQLSKEFTGLIYPYFESYLP